MILVLQALSEKMPLEISETVERALLIAKMRSVIFAVATEVHIDKMR